MVITGILYPGSYIYDHIQVPNMLKENRIKIEASKVTIINNFKNDSSKRVFYSGGAEVKEVAKITKKTLPVVNEYHNTKNK